MLELKPGKYKAKDMIHVFDEIHGQLKMPKGQIVVIDSEGIGHAENVHFPVAILYGLESQFERINEEESEKDDSMTAVKEKIKERIRMMGDIKKAKEDRFKLLVEEMDTLNNFEDNAIKMLLDLKESKIRLEELQYVLTSIF